MGSLSSLLWKAKGQAQHLAVANSPAILTAIGITGVVSTAYLAGKASYTAAGIIRKAEMGKEEPPPEEWLEKLKQRTPYVWRLYIPAASSGAVTIGCMFMATKIGTRRTAAAAAAYSLSERAFSEYKDKVAETLGEKKEAKLRDEVAQTQVDKRPPSSAMVLMSGPGNVLCHDPFNGRYFHSDMESLRRAQNNINDKLLKEGYATLAEFYSYFDAWCSDMSSEMGWTKDKLLELDFSAALYQGTPVLSFEYNYISSPR